MEHKCQKGRWVPGPVVDCLVCRPSRRSAPGQLPEGYKHSTQDIVKDDFGSKEVVHWNGRQDVQIMAQAVKVTSQIEKGS